MSDEVKVVKAEWASTSEKIGELAAALAAAQGEFPAIQKNKTAKIRMRAEKGGGQYTFHYADIADVLAAIRGPMSKQGLAILQNMDGEYLITTLAHKSGEWIRSRVKLPVGVAIQDFGAWLTYMRRYSVSAIAGIAAEDDMDAPNENEEQPEDPQAEERKQAAKDALAKAVEAGRKAVSEGRLKNAHTGEVMKPGEKVTPEGNVPDPDQKPEPEPEQEPAPEPEKPKKKEKDTDGIHVDLLARMNKDGITPAALSKYAVRHLAKEIHPRAFTDDYRGKMIANWDKVVSEIKKGAK